MVTAILASGPLPLKAQEAVQSPQLATAIGGWIERIRFPDLKLVFEGKLDTGADSSSINANNIEVVTRAGERLVRFTIVDDTGKSTQLELPHMRWVRIRRTGGGYDRRPTARLKVCVGGFIVESEFTIADRKTLNYQVLIGRKILAGRLIVDSGRKHLLSDRCAASH